MEGQTIRHEHSHSDLKPELRIKVEKGQRNTYAWEVSASAPGHDVDALLAVIDEADVRLRERYGDVSEPFGPRAA